MSLPTVSVCMVVRDELPFLKELVPSLTYAKEVVVVDAGSRDGTLDWMHEFSKHPYRKHFESQGEPQPWDVDIKVVKALPRTISELGFSHLKNLAASMATGDWIHSLDGDECLDLEASVMLRDKLDAARNDVFHVETATYHGCIGGSPALTQVIVGDTADLFLHRRIYRNRRNITWRGYIHEELYRGGINCTVGAGTTIGRHHHFSNYRRWGKPEYKRWRYSWMLKRGFENPVLRDGTNSWWYTSYVPSRIDAIRKEAELYEKHRDEIDPPTLVGT